MFRDFCAAGCVLLFSLSLAGTASAESFALDESPNDSRVFQVTARLDVAGQLEVAVGGGKAQALKLKVNATHSYRERRLSGAGRDAEAFRSLRQYAQAEALIDVDDGKSKSSSRLSEARQLIVAQGRREGVSKYSPAGPLSRGEIDLLQMPGDSLVMLGLLPRANVEVNERWNTDSWVIQTLTNVDAVAKSELTCEVESASADLAVVRFSGVIEGAAVGASTTINVSGKYRYNRKTKNIESLELEQKEKRSVGAVSPGMNVVARLTLERKPAESEGPLTDALAEKIPLEPDASLLMLTFDAPWGVRFQHDRDWHVFQQTSEAAVLRLIDKGSLITQCNLRKIAPATPGQHTSEETFQNDIQKSLGENFKSITSAEQLKTDDGRFLYRVTVQGEVRTPATEADKVRVTPMQWIYYLCAAPTGEQTSLLFALEAPLAERLGNRDLSLVKGLQFIRSAPTKAQ